MQLSDLAPAGRTKILADHDAETPSGLRGIARELNVSIAKVARRAGLPYVRAERILNSRIAPRPDELAAIRRALGAE